MKKFLYKAGAGIAGVLFVALVMSLVAPKTVQAMVSALVTIANTSANPVPAQEVTESRANFISVSNQFRGSTYNEVSPDGTISSTPFTIPSGEQFVITDVNWITLCENASIVGLTCSRSVGDSVVLVLGGDSSGFAPGSYTSQSSYFNSGIFLTAGRSDSLKSGLVVTQLPTPSILFGPSSNGENILAVTLRGYLVP